MAKVRTTTRPISEKTFEAKADRKMGFVPATAEAPSRRTASSSAEPKLPAKKSG